MEEYVFLDLQEKLNEEESGTFYPYMLGGCGHKYSETEINIMRQLIDNGWQIDTGIVDKRRNTALHIAYCHRNRFMIDFLLSVGADVNARNYLDRLPQDYAPV